MREALDGKKINLLTRPVAMITDAILNLKDVCLLPHCP